MPDENPYKSPDVPASADSSLASEANAARLAAAMPWVTAVAATLTVLAVGFAISAVWGGVMMTKRDPWGKLLAIDFRQLAIELFRVGGTGAFFAFAAWNAWSYRREVWKLYRTGDNSLAFAESHRKLFRALALVGVGYIVLRIIATLLMLTLLHR